MNGLYQGSTNVLHDHEILLDSLSKSNIPKTSSEKWNVTMTFDEFIKICFCYGWDF